MSVEKPEKAGPDATSAEIAGWMEEDFWFQVTEGMAEEEEESNEVG